MKDAIQEQADTHNEDLIEHGIEVYSQVWLYLDRVRDRYARKLAHMWHRTFLVAEMCGDHAVRLEIVGTPLLNVPDRASVKD